MMAHKLFFMQKLQRLIEIVNLEAKRMIITPEKIVGNIIIYQPIFVFLPVMMEHRNSYS